LKIPSHRYGGRKLVRTRDEIAKERSTQERERLASAPPFVMPEFTSDNDGIPYCTKQTDYDKIIALNLKERYPNEFEKVLTCLRCDHYKNDDCYFPKKEIDRIEHDRESLKIKCNLCGTKIHRLFSILMSFYYKAQYNITMPIICCTCFNALNNNSFIKNTQRRMILLAISFATSVYFLFAYFLTLMVLNPLGLVLIIVPFIFWIYMMVRDVKSLYYLYKGRKYYQDVFAPFEESGSNSPPPNPQPAATPNDNPDEPDGDNDDERNRFHSPGYEY
jgi:hypothetical protein